MGFILATWQQTTTGQTCSASQMTHYTQEPGSSEWARSMLSLPTCRVSYYVAGQVSYLEGSKYHRQNLE